MRPTSLRPYLFSCFLPFLSRITLISCFVFFSTSPSSLYAKKATPFFLIPDAIGFRLLTGGAQHPIHGGGMSFEWPIFHHHAEIETALNVINHEPILDELGALLCKVPFLHLSSQLELIFGFGGVIETIQSQPYVGITADIGSRFWFTSHWGVSTELEYVYLIESMQDSILDGIFEILYRF